MTTRRSCQATTDRPSNMRACAITNRISRHLIFTRRFLIRDVCNSQLDLPQYGLRPLVAAHDCFWRMAGNLWSGSILDGCQRLFSNHRKAVVTDQYGTGSPAPQTVTQDAEF